MTRPDHPLYAHIERLKARGEYKLIPIVVPSEGYGTDTEDGQ